jgi:CheY-like chemotaxis protein
MRVLVVEDEVVMAEAVRIALERAAIAADVVHDGESALEALAVNDYDAVLLDRDLPGIHGDDVAKQIAASEMPVRVLMLTAARGLDNKVEGFEIGADDYLSKPFEVPELIELTPTDATSGVGATRYRVGGGAWTDGTTVELATRGVHTVEFFSLDVAGNAEAVKSVTGEIVIPDRIPPTVTHTVSNPGTNGWYLGGAAVTVSATDSESGVASVEYRLAGGGWQLYGDPVVLPEGETLFEYRATDVAGNVSGILSERIRVDGTRPGVWAWLSSAGRVRAVGTDSASGMQRLEYSLDGSTWGDLSSVVTATPKPESLSVRAIDRAGNASAVQEVVRTARPSALSIEPGSSILVEGSGFTKGAKVRVELHSDPLLLATATATANGVGVISALASVPADFPSGAHSLVLVEQGGAAVTRPTQIAATGFAADIWVPLGAGALLILGAALLVLTRRRRAAQVKR